MKIVILMGGAGERFSSVGYKEPKPFITVDGKTMAEHVVDMYPGDNDFIFVCKDEFREHPRLRPLRALPRAEIVYIPPHKLGPVKTLSYVWDRFEPNEPVMVSYCDFSAQWNFQDFVERVASREWDSAVPSYTGFHPHLLHRKLYAGILADDTGLIKHLREKHCFTPNPEESFHSAGNYYFARAGEMRQYGAELLRSDERINGEQYLSMIYYYYLKAGKRNLVYPLTHFLQWGTPEDLEEYEAWSRLIQGEHKGVTEIPVERSHLIQIPHPENTREYERSLAYWSDHFAHKTAP